jgi:hypothetical protein
MPRDPHMLEAEVQQVLDQLWNERLIPFRLSVGKITKEPTEYTIHFYDSRIHTASVPLNEDQPFKDRVRAAVLDRVDRITGPLKKPRSRD